MFLAGHNSPSTNCDDASSFSPVKALALGVSGSFLDHIRMLFHE
jgi:hypothetical protein